MLDAWHGHGGNHSIPAQEGISTLGLVEAKALLHSVQEKMGGKKVQTAF